MYGNMRRRKRHLVVIGVRGDLMTQLALNLLPGGISMEVLGNLLTDADGRTLLLQATIQRFEERYTLPLEALVARLARGEGAEHPDWEDSIEWRNAAETLQRTEKMRSLLEWLLRSTKPLPIS
jgi:hypothetical protein